MARSITAPFRRELEVTTAGELTESQGIYVGDIKTLHFSYTGTFNILVKGRIGTKGFKSEIKLNFKNKRATHVDITDVEYINITIVDVRKAGTLTVFGYYDSDIETTTITTQPIGRGLERDIENNITLREIKEELVKLNTYMSIITGEDL